ncbi:MAG: hypothetical protein ACOYOA_11805 [Saprospiraceae bacterium]
MKKLFIILLFSLLLGCSSGRYLLTDTGNDSKYLIERISALEKEGKVKQHPLLVIDGKVYDYKTLKEQPITLSKADIKQIDCLPKDGEGATNIYGESGKKGVLLITTAKSDDIKILFFIGDWRISQEEAEKINPNDIEFINVIKDKDKVRAYTTEDYDGVVIITMKKEEKE